MEHYILILEDSPACQKIAVESLKKIARIKLATTLKEAREFLANNRVSLVLLDIQLPDGDGLEFFGEMQTKLNLSDVPVIFVSGNEDINKKIAAFSIGADDYLVKPYSPMELKVRVERIFRTRKNSEIFKDEKSGLVLDLTKYEASYQKDGEHIKLSLTPHEFKILYLLAKNHSQIFTRQQILDNAWGQGVFLTQRTVDVHVSSLRKKVDPRIVNIISVRGEGYKAHLGSQNKAA